MDTVFQLIWTEVAIEQYEALNTRLKKQVDKALQRILKKPKTGKPLLGELKGIWSERVSNFRILYKIYPQEIKILVLTIEHRKTVYGGH